MQFVDEVKGGNIPMSISSIQKALRTPCRVVLAGYPLDKLKVTVIDGSTMRWTHQLSFG